MVSTTPHSLEAVSSKKGSQGGNGGQSVDPKGMGGVRSLRLPGSCRRDTRDTLPPGDLPQKQAREFSGSCNLCVNLRLLQEGEGDRAWGGEEIRSSEQKEGPQVSSRGQGPRRQLSPSPLLAPLSGLPPLTSSQPSPTPRRGPPPGAPPSLEGESCTVLGAATQTPAPPVLALSLSASVSSPAHGVTSSLPQGQLGPAGD